MTAILTNIYYTVIRELPTGLEFQDVECAALLRAKVTESSIRDVISLQRELVEARQQLGDGADGLVSDVDAIRQS